MTRSLKWRRVPGVPATALAAMLSLDLAQGADLIPALPPPAPAPYAAPAPVQPGLYDPYRMEVRFGGFLHGVGGNEKGTYDWNAFRDRLVAEIVEGGSEYYPSWLNALESLLISRGVVTPEQIDQRAAEYRNLERDPVF